MIIEAFNKAEVAFRYYKRVNPDRNYPKDQAKKQFFQDKKIDYSIVLEVITAIYNEQKAQIQKLIQAKQQQQ